MVASCVALAACAPASEPEGADTFEPEGADTLRAAAMRHGLRVGPAIRLGPLQTDALYRSVLVREFDIVTPEVEMTWEHVHPARGEYRFERLDALVGFARGSGLAVHGHTLVWHQQNPPWLSSRRYSRSELIEILRDHISTVVGRYRGEIELWDVVNEPVEIDSSPDGDGALRESFWLETIGPEYIELGFRFAHEADPDAQLIYNQVGIEESSSATSLSLLDGLLERGVPVDGVGFQMHVQLDGEPVLEHVSRLAELMADVAARGLDVYITEMDVAVPEPWTQVKGEDQAAVYDAALTACLNQPACKGFQTWGFTDKYTWISEHFPGWTSPLLFDESYAPKSAYHALLDRLRLEPPKPR